MIYLKESATPDNRAAAHTLLQRALCKEYGVTGDLTFVYGSNGKPSLSDYPNIFFNLTHCRLGAACVVADTDVGIDMQDVRPYNAGSLPGLAAGSRQVHPLYYRAAKRVCTENELARLAASSEPEKLFCMLWAVKEAYVKWHGGSIMGGVIDTEAVLADAFLYEGAGYWLCCFGCDKITRVAG